MSITIDAATARLIREMGASEAALDDALINTISLMHTAALAQREISEAPSTKAQSTMLRLSKLVSGLVEARGEALRVHGELLDIGREMGATEIPYCPEAQALNVEQSKAA